MSVIGIQSAIWENKTKTVIILTLFPILLGLVVLGISFIMGQGDTTKSLEFGVGIGSILGPIMIIWGIISYFSYKSIIFSFSGAKEITRKENPEIYNIIENLCISRGLANPKIGIIDDMSYNAFAIGWSMKDSRIVFSRGILEKLDKAEIEAVAAHELTHIINKDSLIMTLIIVYIGIVATLGDIILRVGLHMKGGKKEEQGARLILILLGIALLMLGYIVFPLMKLALSRKRELLADAGSAELTKNPDALISSLQKISGDPYIESITKQTIGSLCIESPFKEKTGFVGWFSNLFNTHPSISKRIEYLKKY